VTTAQGRRSSPGRCSHEFLTGPRAGSQDDTSGRRQNRGTDDVSELARHQYPQSKTLPQVDTHKRREVAARERRRPARQMFNDYAAAALGLGTLGAYSRSQPLDIAEAPSRLV
jgi:hypothetical protein